MGNGNGNKIRTRGAANADDQQGNGTGAEESAEKGSTGAAGASPQGDTDTDAAKAAAEQEAAAAAAAAASENAGTSGEDSKVKEAAPATPPGPDKAIQDAVYKQVAERVTKGSLTFAEAVKQASDMLQLEPIVVRNAVQALVDPNAKPQPLKPIVPAVSGFENLCKQKFEEDPALVEKIAVVVAKPFKIQLDSHTLLEIAAGTYKLERFVAEHWWAKNNGVKQLEVKESADA